MIDQPSTTAVEQPSIIMVLSQEEISFFSFNRDKILILYHAGVFVFPSGQININVNNNVFQNVYFNRLAYKRDSKFESIPI